MSDYIPLIQTGVPLSLEAAERINALETRIEYIEDVNRWNLDALNLVAKEMTPQQIAEARRRAAEWKPKSGEDKDGKPAK